jgi:hypothetical protein
MYTIYRRGSYLHGVDKRYDVAIAIEHVADEPLVHLRKVKTIKVIKTYMQIFCTFEEVRAWPHVRSTGAVSQHARH